MRGRAAANSASEDRRVIYSGNDLGFRERRTGRRRREGRNGGKRSPSMTERGRSRCCGDFLFVLSSNGTRKGRERRRGKGRYLLSRVSTRTVKREKPRQNRDGETEETEQRRRTQDSTRGRKEGRRFCFRLSFSAAVAVPCFSRPTAVSPFSTPRFRTFFSRSPEHQPSFLSLLARSSTAARYVHSPERGRNSGLVKVTQYE